MAIRLLLVDDHRMVRESLRRSMEDEGFEVLGEAADGEEAVRRTTELRPDVVLMDVSMPEMDGVEATRRITAEIPDVRVVMLTMHADADVVDRALKAGASGYLIKDCTIEEVAQAVRMAADGETAMSRDLAMRMLTEVKNLAVPTAREEDRIITKREEEVLQLIADGCSTPEVAARLYISQKTVKNHLASIYEKLDARDRTQAVLQAVRMGIVHLR
ncbi:MAG: response regulator [Acidimicrobiia bacterium]